MDLMMVPSADLWVIGASILEPDQVCYRGHGLPDGTHQLALSPSSNPRLHTVFAFLPRHHE
jgi:hypothetical protein